MNVDCGIVIYVINRIIIKVNINIIISILMNNKEKISVVVKEYEFISPDINNIDSIFNKCVRDCYNRYFHAFQNKCKY